MCQLKKRLAFKFLVTVQLICFSFSLHLGGLGFSGNALKIQTRINIIKKVREVAISPPPPPYTPKATCINFGMWGRVLDVINHAKF